MSITLIYIEKVTSAKPFSPFRSNQHLRGGGGGDEVAMRLAIKFRI